MREDRKELIASLYLGSISKLEFLNKYFNNKIPKDEYVLELFKKGIIHKDRDIIEEAMTLLYTGVFSYPLYLNELCKLLQMPWHMKHEDIAMLLKEMSEPNSVEYLYNAAELQLHYLEYDDTYQFGRKCIKALSNIGNENAMVKLKILSESKITKIAEYAKKELRYKKIL